ncbi:hypothetical protein CKA32_003120 [Geitlerinema sp. FC II]|nr:hypothetical protein CKA32_003120 [Geitlerinema sp. FC II]
MYHKIEAKRESGTGNGESDFFWCFNFLTTYLGRLYSQLN